MSADSEKIQLSHIDERFPDRVREAISNIEEQMPVQAKVLFREMQRVADAVNAARDDVAGIKPASLRRNFPEATDELDAIVSSTEEATGEILGAAETLETLSETLTPEEANVVNDAVTRIYEACNFQDLTGQRVTKIVRALKEIEEKVLVLLDTFGQRDTEDDVVDEVVDDGIIDDADLLNGPALPNAGNTQEDIDALFASMD